MQWLVSRSCEDMALKVFFLTSTPPIPTWGGAMAFYRHFVEQDGFKVAVATDDPQVHQFSLPCPVSFVQAQPWLRRVQKTRLSRWAHAFQHFVAGSRVPESVFQFALDFKPELVLTVAGSWSWTADMAQQLARRLRVPLVGSFNDWFDYNLILPNVLRTQMEKKFRRFYRDCDLALCTCEGMRDALGEHPNAMLHYPTGATRSGLVVPLRQRGSAPFRVLFGGNLGEWYGPMLEQIVMAARESGKLGVEVEFVICGSNPGWSTSFDLYARNNKIFLGQVPFAELKVHAQKSDALLLLMGFGERNATVERTSFKTKFLDYLSFERPIIVWGPEYSSAVRTAKEFDSAEACISPAAGDCLERLLALGRNPNRQAVLLANARQMYESRFNPAKIHAEFFRKIQEVVQKNKQHANADLC